MTDCWPCFFIAGAAIAIIVWIAVDFYYNNGRS